MADYNKPLDSIIKEQRMNKRASISKRNSFAIGGSINKQRGRGGSIARGRGRGRGGRRLANFGGRVGGFVRQNASFGGRGRGARQSNLSRGKNVRYATMQSKSRNVGGTASALQLRIAQGLIKKARRLSMQSQRLSELAAATAASATSPIRRNRGGGIRRIPISSDGLSTGGGWRRGGGRGGALRGSPRRLGVQSRLGRGILGRRARGGGRGGLATVSLDEGISTQMQRRLGWKSQQQQPRGGFKASTRRGRGRFNTAPATREPVYGRMRSDEVQRENALRSRVAALEAREVQKQARQEQIELRRNLNNNRRGGGIRGGGRGSQRLRGGINRRTSFNQRFLKDEVDDDDEPMYSTGGGFSRNFGDGRGVATDRSQFSLGTV